MFPSTGECLKNKPQLVLTAWSRLGPVTSGADGHAWECHFNEKRQVLPPAVTGWGTARLPTELQPGLCVIAVQHCSLAAVCCAAVPRWQWPQPVAPQKHSFERHPRRCRGHGCARCWAKQNCVRNCRCSHSTGLFLCVKTGTCLMVGHRHYQAEFNTLSQGDTWAGLMGSYKAGLGFELCRAKWDPFSIKSDFTL